MNYLHDRIRDRKVRGIPISQYNKSQYKQFG